MQLPRRIRQRAHVAVGGHAERGREERAGGRAEPGEDARHLAQHAMTGGQSGPDDGDGADPLVRDLDPRHVGAERAREDLPVVHVVEREHEPRRRARHRDLGGDGAARLEPLDHRGQRAGGESQERELLLRRDPGDPLRVRPAAHDRLLRAAERRARVDRDALLLRELDGLGVQHLRARLRELLHLLVGERVEPPRRGDDARIGGEDAVDVAVDLAVARRAPPRARPRSCPSRRGRAS